MRPILSLALTLLTTLASAQVTLFQTGFDVAPAPFDLNTTDVGSTASGSNTWLINNVYAGGNGDVICSGFPLNFTIPSTAGQPVAITNPNGNYLHIASSEAVADGILCASFAAADGFCTNQGNHFAGMNTDVSTAGQTDVTLGFWWLCNGGNQNYGEVYYSTNSGASWSLITTPIAQYRNQSNWTQQTITLPAFANQATLRFGFRFFNATSLLGGTDPGFAVDDVAVTAASLGTNAISCQTSGNQFCTGQQLVVSYTAQGAYTAGNTFTAQLSDAGGSFASPTDIGSVSSTTSGTISCQIPLGTPAGFGYQIRVVASAPVTIGTSAPVNITISPVPNAGNNSTVSVCSNTASFNLINFLGGSPDAGGTWTDPLGTPFSGTFIPGVSPQGCYTYTVAGSGPCPNATSVICISVDMAPNAGNNSTVTVCSNTAPFSLFSFLGGTPDPGGTWTDPLGNPIPGSFIPGVSLPGCYTYTVLGTGACASDSSTLCIAVNTAPNAGVSYSGAACSNGAPFLLISLLGPTAQPNGTWTINGAPSNGVFVPGVSVPGCYIYTVTGNAPCASASAIVCITGVVTAPDAGLDSSIVICANGGIYDLFDGLGGTPDSGGTWLTFGGQPFNGLFDPQVNTPGPYIYQADGTAPCANDQTLVTVTVDPCMGVQAHEAPDLRLLASDGLGRYTLVTGAPVRTVMVVDVHGRIVRPAQRPANPERFEVDLADLAPGAYLVVANTAIGQLAIRLIHAAP